MKPIATLGLFLLLLAGIVYANVNPLALSQGGHETLYTNTISPWTMNNRVVVTAPLETTIFYTDNIIRKSPGDPLITFNGHLNLQDGNSAGVIYFGAGSGGLKNLYIRSGSPSNYADRIFVSGETGNVGIGTTNPTQKLDVNGNARITGNLQVNTLSSFSTISIGQTTNLPNADGMLRINPNTKKLEISAYDPNEDKYAWVPVGNDKWSSNNNNIFYNDGNVGIGTTNPTQKLDVVGNVKANAFCLGQNCITTWPVGGTGTSPWTLSGSNIFYTSGNVGIGTNVPSYKLDIFGNVRISGDIIIDLSSTQTQQVSYKD
ncbi:MAG: hypothetical protein QW594_00660 [Candidatus Woesearchaeota archaeon]